MQIKTFFIGDTHFCHKNIVTFTDNEGKKLRPFDTIEEHDAEIIKRWNQVVQPQDKVFHLGDFCFGGWENVAIAGKLNGRKHLIMGNHDHYAGQEYLKYFEKISGSVEYKGGILTHIPIHPEQLSTRFRFNIHGHLHHHKLDELGYIGVSCEQVNYTPISFDLLKARNPVIEGQR